MTRRPVAPLLIRVLMLALLAAPAVALPPPAVEAAPEAPVPATANAPAPDPSTPSAAVPTAPAATAEPTSASTSAAAVAAEAAPPWAQPLREEARKVLAGEDFHQHKTSHDLVARDWLRRLLDFDTSPAPKQPPALPDFAWLADGVKVLLVTLLALALGWLLWRGRAWLGPLPGRTQRPSAPVLVAARSLALTDMQLPAGISVAARQAWQAGDAVLALSLLYRGAVRALEQQYRITLPASATEGECLRQARASGKAVVGAAFAPIVQAWVTLAYARRAPADFERLLTLYTQHFEAAAEQEATS